jgi:hypothetical protein
MKEWEMLLATVASNKDDLPYIDGYRQQLEVEMAGAKAASVRQSASQAEAQQASRDLEEFLTRGRDLANRMRSGVRAKYGIRGEKLKEFGLRVFRGKKKTSSVKPPPAGGPSVGGPSTGGTQHAGSSPTPQAAIAQTSETHVETK